MRSLLLFFGILTANAVVASPVSDLASPSQATREAAAKELRATYVAPSRAKWEFLLAGLTPGEKREKALALLRPLTYESAGRDNWENGFVPTGTHPRVSEAYRLDDRWLLICHWAPGDA
jgi:ATP-dependent exoDNAse (exonuclease V) beta subunit